MNIKLFKIFSNLLENILNKSNTLGGHEILINKIKLKVMQNLNEIFKPILNTGQETSLTFCWEFSTSTKGERFDFFEFCTGTKSPQEIKEKISR